MLSIDCQLELFDLWMQGDTYPFEWRCMLEQEEVGPGGELGQAL